MLWFVLSTSSGSFFLRSLQFSKLQLNEYDGDCNNKLYLLYILSNDVGDRKAVLATSEDGKAYVVKFFPESNDSVVVSAVEQVCQEETLAWNIISGVYVQGFVWVIVKK